MKYEYRVFNPELPPPDERTNIGPMMDSTEMNRWLNHMSELGWEFVGQASTHWVNGPTQEWWIFKREIAQ